MTDVIRIPVQATMRIIDGNAVMISAEYANIDAGIIAQILLRSFKLTNFKGEHNNGNVKRN